MIWAIVFAVREKRPCDLVIGFSHFIAKLHLMERTPPSHDLSRPPTLPATFLLKTALPFVLPVALTFIFVILHTVGKGWPISIAPGSGLMFPGLIASAMFSTLAWRITGGHFDDKQVRKLAAIICAVTGLMGWPIWTKGVLPSINGAFLGQEHVEPMRLGKLDVSRPKGGRGSPNYSVGLEPVHPGGAIDGGRYYISEEVYQRLESQKPVAISVAHARGVLGAVVVTDYR